MTVLRQAAVLLSIALLPALLSAAWHRDVWQGSPAPALSPGEVSPATVALWPESPLWVDARTRARHEEGHIPGAILLDEEEWSALLPGLLARWQPRARVVVYCDSAQCRASAAVARRLREDVGLPDVFVLHGGWEAWREAQP